MYVSYTDSEANLNVGDENIHVNLSGIFKTGRSKFIQRTIHQVPTQDVKRNQCLEMEGNLSIINFLIIEPPKKLKTARSLSLVFLLFAEV